MLGDAASETTVALRGGVERGVRCVEECGTGSVRCAAEVSGACMAGCHAAVFDARRRCMAGRTSESRGFSSEVVW